MLRASVCHCFVYP